MESDGTYGGDRRKPRKTINVEWVRGRANRYLADCPELSADTRKGICSMVEGILMETGNYKGFRYLDGYPCEDETRRYYN